MTIPVIGYETIKQRVGLESVIAPVRDSFISYSHGRSNIAKVQHLEMPDYGHSALHIKSGHVAPLPFCLVKVASTFPENGKFDPPRPSINGVIVVVSMLDGAPLAILEDRAWITQIRTAGAGAVATDLLARVDAGVLGVIGSGTQARLQTAAVIRQRPGISRVAIWGRTPANVRRCADDLRMAHPKVRVEIAKTIESVARAADVLVTATYSPAPLVRGEWLRPGSLVIAMGADSKLKLELDSAAIVGATRVVVDSRIQNEELGEIGYGLRMHAFGPQEIDDELGKMLQVCGTKPGAGRTSDRETIICKLTGIAIQEIFVCNALLTELGMLPAADEAKQS